MLYLLKTNNEILKCMHITADIQLSSTHTLHSLYILITGHPHQHYTSYMYNDQLTTLQTEENNNYQYQPKHNNQRVKQLTYNTHVALIYKSWVTGR